MTLKIRLKSLKRVKKKEIYKFRYRGKGPKNKKVVLGFHQEREIPETF